MIFKVKLAIINQGIPMPMPVATAVIATETADAPYAVLWGKRVFTRWASMGKGNPSALSNGDIYVECATAIPDAVVSEP